MERLIKHILNTLSNLGESEQVALFSIAENKKTAVVAGGFTHGEFIMPGKHIDIVGTPLEEIISVKEANTYPGSLLEFLPFPTYDNYNVPFECFCLPLIDEKYKNVIGVAVIAQKLGISPPDYQIQVLNILRTLIASAVENARLFQLATVDGLTGLFVRRYFEVRLQEELTRIRRHGGAVSLLMMDVDFFKKINDTHGHQQGDSILQELASIVRTSIRYEIDFPCRYGGEEFIILLPSTELEGAVVVAERIRKHCEMHKFMTLNGSTINVTISVGVATVTKAQFMSKESFIEYTDSKLYQAKRNGRNQVAQ